MQASTCQERLYQAQVFADQAASCIPTDATFDETLPFLQSFEAARLRLQQCRDEWADCVAGPLPSHAYLTFPFHSAAGAGKSDVSKDATGCFMTFEHDQHKNPEIVAYTRELFSMYGGSDADKLLVRYMRLHAASLKQLINDPRFVGQDFSLARSRRQWLLHLLSVADRSLSLLRPFMARVIVEGHSAGVAGAAHGGEAARSAGTATGAALAAHPHGNHGDNQQ